MNMAVPSIISSYHNGQIEIWITNLRSGNRVIPRVMYIGLADPLDEGHLCVISGTSHVSDVKQEMPDRNKRQENPLMDCSLMMTP
ncbi:hypothetical protein TNIN_486651 [Trichonephila inaurata madagascariensis]|uniref:Uncharacterized protein n=1 Tax=Trichonephila inaurata madagascariensis TaxID=2747483 RepID=A0A8X7CHL2_9ARAC|nr:hypothetical protein TNIN_486651 [Trichonephila inaurata madagascariensis]